MSERRACIVIRLPTAPVLVKNIEASSPTLRLASIRRETRATPNITSLCAAVPLGIKNYMGSFLEVNMREVQLREAKATLSTLVEGTTSARCAVTILV